ncbi:MAG: 1-acyl-sn-glycerol-3-phosphate acyltransferase [Sideroxydans sp.]|nr:1-acyl-sn-glycerol-3-phosphate acyltransferase [Sideroxydans sp.]
MKIYWYRLLSYLLTALYYHRVRVINPQLLPGDGAVLFVALHRNGAVDGYVYKSVIPRANFLISVQLRRSLLGRIFFSGVEVARSKDGAHNQGENDTALQVCANYVQQGGALVIMPEGSSNLGHRHLPLHKGAARILAQLIEHPELPLRVVPLGIHFERAWAWQSDVEVVVGEAISTTLPAGMTLAEQVNHLHERIAHSLELLAVQADNDSQFATRESIAYAATLGSQRSYFAVLKALEQGMPEVEMMSAQLEHELARAPRGSQLWRHQGVPLMPMNFAWMYPLLWLLLLPLVVFSCVSNVPPLLCAWWAGKRFSDGRNTIALWRLLVGFPCLLLWVASLLLAALWLHLLPLWLAYVAVSVLGLKSLRRVEKLTITLHNWTLAPALRQPLLRWRAELETLMRASDV